MIAIKPQIYESRCCQTYQNPLWTLKFSKCALSDLFKLLSQTARNKKLWKHPLCTIYTLKFIAWKFLKCSHNKCGFNTCLTQPPVGYLVQIMWTKVNYKPFDLFSVAPIHKKIAKIESKCSKLSQHRLFFFLFFGLWVLGKFCNICIASLRFKVDI